MPRKFGANSFLTPTLAFDYTSVNYDIYTETGAGNLNLTVAQSDTSVAMTSAGVRLHKVVGGGSFVPEIRAALQYDLAGDEAEASSTFAGGGAAFTTKGAKIEQFPCISLTNRPEFSGFWTRNRAGSRDLGPE